MVCDSNLLKRVLISCDVIDFLHEEHEGKILKGVLYAPFCEIGCRCSVFDICSMALLEIQVYWSSRRALPIS